MDHCTTCSAAFALTNVPLVLLLYLCVEDVDKQGNKSKAMLWLKFEVDA